ESTTPSVGVLITGEGTTSCIEDQQPVLEQVGEHQQVPGIASSATVPAGPAQPTNGTAPAACAVPAAVCPLQNENTSSADAASQDEGTASTRIATDRGSANGSGENAAGIVSTTSLQQSAAASSPPQRTTVRNVEDEVVVERSPKGRFLRFNRRLGVESYKQVYLGFDTETGREVAWNVIPFTRLTGTERNRIQDEINITKSLDHPRIIHCVNAWKNPQREEIYIITERVTGGSLRNYVSRLAGPLKIKVIRDWARQILEGLQYLHSTKPNPVIHRDLKCDNIFINGNVGEILIGELGLSSWLKKDDSRLQSIVGTPGFMAPELYDERYGTPVDIYAFGMVLVELVSRRFPFAECHTSLLEVYLKVMKGEQPRVVKLIKDPNLQDLIQKCLEKDPTLRPSAEEAANHPFFN
ncbi:unnamed protein product, partial [Amoebophrya sp. A120]